MIKAVLFDFIGTIVQEQEPDIINHCFEMAYADHGIPANREFFKNNRGRDKRSVILKSLSKQQKPLHLAENIYASFKKHVEGNIHHFVARDGAGEIFSWLSSKSILTGIGTGLTRDLFETIFHHCEFDRYHFDYIGISDEIGIGRPAPDMIFNMMRQLKIVNPREILKVGDTVSDILEGKNAGSLTAAILSGTQPESDLINAAPNFLIKSIAEIRRIVAVAN